MRCKRMAWPLFGNGLAPLPQLQNGLETPTGFPIIVPTMPPVFYIVNMFTCRTDTCVNSAKSAAKLIADCELVMFWTCPFQKLSHTHTHVRYTGQKWHTCSCIQGVHRARASVHH
eukprot:1190697-Prorocentrum_minimum.AAC.7